MRLLERLCALLCMMMLGSTVSNNHPSPGYPVCPICGLGLEPSKPEGSVFFGGSSEEIECGDLDLGGQLGFIDPHFCKLMPTYILVTCGCTTATSLLENDIAAVSQDENDSEEQVAPLQGITSDFGLAPNPGLAPCIVCGHGRRVGFPDFDWTPPLATSSPISCGDLEQAGLHGFIPHDQCLLLPTLIHASCNCQDGEAVIFTPAPSTLPSNAPSTHAPSWSSSQIPTTSSPSWNPSTMMPSAIPSTTIFPSLSPSITNVPSNVPSSVPSTSPPSVSPTTMFPSPWPSRLPSLDPTSVPSLIPSTTVYPTIYPTVAPTTRPSKVPSSSPTTFEPSANPTTVHPSTHLPSSPPSAMPSMTTMPSTMSPSRNQLLQDTTIQATIITTTATTNDSFPPVHKPAFSFPSPPVSNLLAGLTLSHHEMKESKVKTNLGIGKLQTKKKKTTLTMLGIHPIGVTKIPLHPKDVGMPKLVRGKIVKGLKTTNFIFKAPPPRRKDKNIVKERQRLRKTTTTRTKEAVNSRRHE